MLTSLVLECVWLTFECRECTSSSTVRFERSLGRGAFHLDDSKFGLVELEMVPTFHADDHGKDQGVLLGTESQGVEFIGEVEHSLNHFFADDFVHPLTGVLKAVGQHHVRFVVADQRGVFDLNGKGVVRRERRQGILNMRTSQKSKRRLFMIL